MKQLKTLNKMGTTTWEENDAFQSSIILVNCSIHMTMTLWFKVINNKKNTRLLPLWKIISVFPNPPKYYWLLSWWATCKVSREVDKHIEHFLSPRMCAVYQCSLISEMRLEDPLFVTASFLQTDVIQWLWNRKINKKVEYDCLSEHSPE